MTIEGKILSGQCDAVFLGDNPLEVTVPHNGSETAKILNGSAEYTINMTDNGVLGGGIVLIESKIKDLKGINIVGDGVKNLSTVVRDDRERITTMFSLKAEGEARVGLTSDKDLSRAIIEFKHTIDK